MDDRIEHLLIVFVLPTTSVFKHCKKCSTQHTQLNIGSYYRGATGNSPTCPCIKTGSKISSRWFIVVIGQSSQQMRNIKQSQPRHDAFWYKIVWNKFNLFSIFLLAYFFCTLNILLAPPIAPLDADFSMWVPEKLYQVHD